MIAAVVLAAGGARRMGRPKQLLPLGGKPLVWHAASVACRAGLDAVVVVTGAHREAVADAVSGLPVRVVHNPGWRAGQAGSLRAGLEALGPGTAAVVFLLADQPLVTPEVISALAAAWRGGVGTIVAPTVGGRRGNPVLLDLARWREGLMALTGDAGARGLIAAHPDEVASVPVDDEDVFFDVDTPEDYVRLLKLYPEIGGG